MTYDIFEHRHRFACWGAARAAQRGFTTTTIIVAALDTTGIRSFVSDPKSLHVSMDEFDDVHLAWRRAFCQAITAPNATHGRAAKVIAIYLKTMVITNGHHDSMLAHVAHPPIDRILLQTLANDARINSVHAAAWRTTKWTELDERPYDELIGQLREVTGQAPFWTLEQWWRPSEGAGG